MSWFPVAFRPTGVRFSGHPGPAGELGLPHGRLTGHVTVPDPDGVTTFHTHEQRPGWVPPVPRGRRCSPGRQKVPDRRLPLFYGPAPTPHLEPPIGEAHNNETSTEVHAIHPSGLALTCSPRMERGPSGLNPELRTPPSPVTHVRAGTGHRALARNYTTDQSRPSYLRVHSPRATSCRNWPSPETVEASAISRLSGGDASQA